MQSRQSRMQSHRSWGDTAGQEAPDAASIAGISALKCLILYGATLTFAALYGYFITRIFGAKPGHPPKLDGVMVSTAAALAGVLAGCMRSWPPPSR